MRMITKTKTLKRLIAREGLVILSLLMLSGCVSINYNLVPTIYPGQNQKIIYFDGKPILISKSSNVTIASLARLQNTDGINLETMVLHIGYVNESDHIIDVDPSIVRVVAYYSEGKSEQLRIIPPDEFLSNLKFNQDFVRAINAFSNAVTSQQDARTPTVQANTTTYSSGTYSGRSNYSGYTGDVYANMRGSTWGRF